MSYYSVWVGGLKGVVQEKDLTKHFSSYGDILHVIVTRDPETKKSRHCGFVVYRDESTAERAAARANGTVIYGGSIIARGPAQQRLRGYSGKYDGKIGYVPTIENDKRPLTDCIHYVTGVCTNGFNCPYRHSQVARNSRAPICPAWTSNRCADINCAMRHPGPKQLEASASSDMPVVPLYALSLHDQEGTICLATRAQFDLVMSKFNSAWADSKGKPGEVKAVYIIDSPHLKRTWTRYRQSLPPHFQQTEEHYHGTKIKCDISRNNDLCCDRDCSVCRIAESGFDELKIKTSFLKFQRFGRGIYLAPKSSKCHDYTEGAFSYRALLLCDVSPGNKYPLRRDDTTLQGPPSNYHSIHGQAGERLNFDEIVLPRADAILPKYIIVYRKDGEKKIAK